MANAEEQQLPSAAPHVHVPEHPDAQWCLDLERQLSKSTWTGTDALRQTLDPNDLQQILSKVSVLLNLEPTLLQVGCICRGHSVLLPVCSACLTKAMFLCVKLKPCESDQKVTVVGDTHGQYHDVCRL